MKNSLSRIYNNLTCGHQREYINNILLDLKVFCNYIRPVLAEISPYYLRLKYQFYILHSHKIK